MRTNIKSKEPVYREIAQVVYPEECPICGNVFQEIIVHHIDGNNKNNKKDNLIKVCKKCHMLIHTGCRSERKYYEQRLTLAGAGVLRLKWLRNKRYKIPNSEEDFTMKAMKPIIL